MKLTRFFSLLTACILLAHAAFAQFTVGTKGMTIKAGTTTCLDSLILRPTADHTLISNTLHTGYTASSGIGAPGIDRIFSFSSPLNNYSGGIGLFYANAELNGNYGPWLVMTYTSDNITWKANRNCISAANQVQTAGTGLSNDTVLKISAVNGVNFYSKSTGDLTSVATWGTNADGTGLLPADFSNPVNYFIVSNRSGTVSLSNNWILRSRLVINSGIDLQIGSHSLTVKNVTCNGTIGGNTTSTLTIRGTAALHFTSGANALGTVILDTNSFVTLLDTLKLAAGSSPGVLTSAAGAVLNTGGYLKLLSDSSGTARLGNIAGTINGDVTCMQYIFGGHRAYRFWAHPFSNYIPLSQIQNYIDITGMGGAANGFTTTASNAASCYWYHTTVGNSTLSSDPGWKTFNSCFSTVDSNRFKRYQGIRLYIRGLKGEGLGYIVAPPSPVTIGMWGPVNQGNQNIILLKGGDTTKDYNLVGNPYASPTDIGTVIAAARDSGLIRGAAFYIWNPYRGAAGGFEPKTIGSPYVIQAYNSFQIRTTVSGATLNFTESNKSASPAQILLKPEPQYTALQVYDAAYHPWDITYFNFTADATDAEDITADAGKLNNPDMNFYSVSSNNQKLSIDARPYKEGAVIPMGFSCNYAQQFIIRADQMVLPEGGKLYLHDKYTNKFVRLEYGTEYRFEITNDSVSQGENRFELAMGDDSTVGNNELNITLAPNPASDEIAVDYTTNSNDESNLRILDMAGVCMISHRLSAKEHGHTKIKLDKLAAGIYMVELTSGNKIRSEKFIKE